MNRNQLKKKNKLKRKQLFQKQKQTGVVNYRKNRKWRGSVIAIAWMNLKGHIIC